MQAVLANLGDNGIYLSNAGSTLCQDNPLMKR
jgi:hypothetical protein